MPNREFWITARKRTAIEIQIGGAGNKWEAIDMNDGYSSGMMNAISGGKQGVTNVWGRGSNGRDKFTGLYLSGNKEMWTGQLDVRTTTKNWINGPLRDYIDKCAARCTDDYPNIRIRQYCGTIEDRTDYIMLQDLIAVKSTSGGFSANLAEDSDGVENEQRTTESVSAGLGLRSKKLDHLDITDKGNIEAAVNDVIYICDDEFWYVTDQEATPGYVSDPTALFAYTLDNGDSIEAQIPIVPFQNGDAYSIVRVGANMVIAGSAGIVIANIDEVKNWTLPFPTDFWNLAYATGAVNRVFHVQGDLLYAVRDSGIILKSIDGGNTWTTDNNAVTTAQNLTHLYFPSEDLGWFVGATGTVVRYYKGEYKLIAVSGLSAAINHVSVPEGRLDECYLATANGNIYRSQNARVTKSTPTFTAMSSPQLGSGSINRIYFVGFRGHFMYVIASNSESDSRIYRDLSGGAFGQDVEIIGEWQTPVNNGLNALALAHENFGLTGGEIENTYAFLGKVTF